MRSVRILFRLACAGAAIAALAASGCASRPAPDRSLGAWEGEMRSGVDAANAGDAAAAIAFFARAVEVALGEPDRPNHLAYASWHLGDLCFKQPGLCPDGEAEASTQLSFDTFAGTYGPEHPVVIPVLLRLAEIRERRGDATGAEQLRVEADEITAHWFPPSHFLRAHMGAYRPASSLHPQELLRILSELDLLDG